MRPSYVVIFCSASASLIIFATPNPGKVLTGTNSIDNDGGIIDGGHNTGYFLQSGSLSISNATLQNFTTTGGAGSGGGGGFGGVVFVNDGATLTLNNVNFYGNLAIGGNAGTGVTGGKLNNLLMPTSNGVTGVSGDSAPTGTGAENGGNGRNGYNGYAGGNASAGFGGAGGKGGKGDDGDAVTADQIKTAAEITFDTTKAVIDAAKSADEAVKSDAEAEKSAEEADKASEEAEKSVEEADKAIEEEIKAGEEDAKGVEEEAKSVEQAVKGGEEEAIGATEEADSIQQIAVGAVEAGEVGIDPSEDALAATSGAETIAEGGIKLGEGVTELALGAEDIAEGITDAAEAAEDFAEGAEDAAEGATDALESATDTAEAATDTAESVSDATESAADAEESGEDAAAAAADLVMQAAQTAYLVATQVTSYQTTGVAGIGGSGGNGGNGGNGSFGFGGGKGGDGGDGGAAVSTSIASGGNGGGGGDGGKGGFGGGGGRAGNGGSGGANGSHATVHNGSLNGSPGGGGLGGFGAGAGSDGDGTTDGTNGTAGAGYGGSIFIRSGATLNINGPALFDHNDVQGGSSLNQGSAGDSAGTDIFMMKNSTVNLNPGSGNTVTFNGTIADDSAASISTAYYSTGQGAGLNVQSGLVIFNNSNTYTGQTNISGGVLQADDGTGVNTYSNINLSGGILQTSGSFNRFVGTASNRVQWTGSGGFAANGDDLTVTLNKGARLNWNSGSFVPNNCKLVFGSSSATNNVTLTNDIDLTEGTRTVMVTDNGSNTDWAILSGNISNGALTIGDNTHTGTVALTGTNTYTGTTHVAGGTLDLQGTLASPTITIDSGATLHDVSGGIIDSAAMTVNGHLNLSTDETVGTLAGSGVVALGVNHLTVDSGGTFSGVITGQSNSTLTSLSALTLSGDSTYSGTTEVLSGTLTLTGSLASQTVNVASGATLTDHAGLSDTSTLTNYGTVTLGADDMIGAFVNAGTLNGTGYALAAATYALNSGSLINANLAAGALTTNGNVTINGTTSASTIDVATGVATLGSAGRLSNMPALSVEGTLTLGGNEAVESIDGTGTISVLHGTLTVDAGDFSGNITGSNSSYGLTKTDTEDTLTLSGDSTYIGTTQVNGGTLVLTGSLASHTVNVASSGILELDSSALASGAALTNDGTLNLGASNTVSSLTNTGTINGTDHTLTASTYALNDESVVNANIGTGTLTSHGTVELRGTTSASTINIASGTTTLGSAARIASSPAVSVTGTLDLGGAETVGALSGSGNISVQEGTLTVNSGTFSGVVSGTDTNYGLAKVSSGTLTLSGANTYAGATNVNLGTVTLTGSLNSGSLTVDSGATFNDNSAGLTDTVAVTVNGTLALASDDGIGTLAGSGAVHLNSSGLTVNHGGDFSGVISDGGSGNFTSVGALTLSGSNTYTGQTHVTGGVLSLTGSLASHTVTISSGATLDDMASGLASNASVTNAGTLNLAANDTITTLTNTGIINGSTGATTLMATNYNLNDGSLININLGAGTMTTTGIVDLFGTSQTNTVNIHSGSTLNLIGQQLLPSTATVNLDGTLALNGGAQTISVLNGNAQGVVNANSYQFVVTNGGDFQGQINASNTQLHAQGGSLNLTNSSNIQTDTIQVTGTSGSVVTSMNLSGTTSTTNGVTVGDGTNNNSLNLTNNSTLTGSGTGAFVVNPGAVLTVASGSSFTTPGGFTIHNSGVVSVDGTSSLSADTITTAASSTLTVSDGADLSYSTLTGYGNILSDTFINNVDSTINGSLTFSGNLINNGILDPGFSPGLTVVGGNYTENALLSLDVAGTFPATFAGPNTHAYSQVQVAGVTTLGGSSSLKVDAYGGWEPARGDVYQIISNGSGGPTTINGTFSSVEFSNDGPGGPYAVNAAVVFDLHTGQLLASGLNSSTSVFGDLGVTTNQSRAATALFDAAQIGENQIDTSGINGRLAAQMLNAGCDLSRYVPDYYGAMSDYAFMGDRALVRSVWNRVSPFNAPSGSSSKKAVFIGSLDSHASNADKADMSRGDYMIGGDLSRDNGLAVGATVSKISGKMKHASVDKSRVNGLAGMIYAHKDIGTCFATFASVVYSTQDHELKRMTTNGFASAKATAQVWTGSLGLQYTQMRFGKFRVIPRCNLVYSHAKIDGFSEGGPSNALYNDGYRDNMLTGELGLAVVLPTQWFGRDFNLEILGGTEHMLAHRKNVMNVGLVQSPSVKYAIDFAHDRVTRFTYGLNMGYNIWKQAVLDVGYEGMSGGKSDHSVSASLRINL